MPQYFPTLPHDTASEPAMASLQERGPAALEALSWSERASAAVGSRIEVRALREGPE